MKTLRCDNCGANLEDFDSVDNVKCEYCGSVIRVRDEGEFNAAALLAAVGNVIEISRMAINAGAVEDKYESVKKLVEKHEYRAANDVLNEILREDEKESRAWFLKSLLPVLEQESVLYHGCYINISLYSKLTKKEDITMYLDMCGLSRVRHRGFRAFYRSKDFLYEQQLKFIDNAIECASPERREYFEKEKKEIIDKQKRKNRKIFWTNMFVVLGFTALVAGLTYLFVSGTFSKWIK